MHVVGSLLVPPSHTTSEGRLSYAQYLVSVLPILENTWKIVYFYFVRKVETNQNQNIPRVTMGKKTSGTVINDFVENGKMNLYKLVDTRMAGTTAPVRPFLLDWLLWNLVPVLFTNTQITKKLN